jgi:hypothetical protein
MANHGERQKIDSTCRPSSAPRWSTSHRAKRDFAPFPSRDQRRRSDRLWRMCGGAQRREHDRCSPPSAWGVITGMIAAFVDELRAKRCHTIFHLRRAHRLSPSVPCRSLRVAGTRLCPTVPKKASRDPFVDNRGWSMRKEDQACRARRALTNRDTVLRRQSMELTHAFSDGRRPQSRRPPFSPSP